MVCLCKNSHFISNALSVFILECRRLQIRGFQVCHHQLAFQKIALLPAMPCFYEVNEESAQPVMPIVVTM